MKVTIYQSDGSVYESTESIPPVDDETPVEILEEDLPDGQLASVANGRVFGVVLHDELFTDRSPKLNETNEIQRIRPVKPAGLLGLIARFFGWVSGFITPVRSLYYSIGDLTRWQVYPSGVITVRVDKIIQWWQMIVDGVGGARNAELFVTPGDGFMDGNDAEVPLLTPQHPDIYYPNPQKELKLNVFATAGMAVEIDAEIVQGAGKFWVIKLMDYNSPPEKINGVWYYKGQPVSWKTHPHWFTSRVNRRGIAQQPITWLTRNKIVSVTDAGQIGGAGDEHWPAPIPDKAALEQSKVQVYELPIDLTINLYSYVIDGNIVKRTGGIKVTIDAMLYHGSSTYGHTTTGKWYLLEEMLVRADSVQRTAATGFDWRCYASRDGQYPYMGYRSYRVPECGWVRTS